MREVNTCSRINQTSEDLPQAYTHSTLPKVITEWSRIAFSEACALVIVVLVVIMTLKQNANPDTSPISNLGVTARQIR